MKDIQQIIKLAGLIAKSICNQTTAEEKEILNSWKNESSNNKTLFSKITDWDNYKKRNQTYQSFDTEKAWARFSLKMSKTHSNKRFLTVFKYAAAVITPLMLGGLLFYYLSNKPAENLQKVAEISPGTKNAVIILDDGKSINLGELKSDQLIESDGTVLNKKDGTLSYSGNTSGQSKKQLKNTLLVPRGGEYSLILSDGSRVFLNSVSKLTYPVVFNNEKREVSLEGEAYFEIAKDTEHPFIVNVNGMKVEVLGTSFNIKAYSDESEIYTTLVEGKIKLNAGENEKDWILSPDQQAILEKSNSRVEIREVDVLQFVSWKNGVFTFADETLEDILKTLARWYNFEYEFDTESLKSIRFEGGLNKYDDIIPILDIMQSTGKLKYEIEGGKITFLQK